MIAAAVLAAAAVGTAKPALPPIIYQAATRDYDARLRIAPELKAMPVAYAALRARALSDLRGFEAGAVADMARTRRQAPGSVMAKNPEVARIEIDFVARTPHLAGFIRRDYLDAHGAHPASDMAGLLFDTASGRRLAATDLLRPGVDRAALDAALLKAVEAAKARRGQSLNPADGFVKPGQIGWSGGVDLTASHDLFAPDASGMDRRTGEPVLATLTASTDRHRAGGLQFLYSPYDIGPYVEGAYRVVLPARVFAADLKPEFRQDFGGAPAGDLTSDPLANFPADVPPIVQ